MQQYVAVVQFKCEAENVVARIKLMNGKHNHTICTVCESFSRYSMEATWNTSDFAIVCQNAIHMDGIENWRRGKIARGM